MGITFQAVSAWERDEYKPDTDNLVKLAEYFGVSVSAIAEEKHGAFKTKDAIYDWEHMKTYVKIQSDSDQSQSCAHKVPGQM